MVIANREITYNGTWCYPLHDWPRIIDLIARRGLPVALHTPSEVKAAVTGSGRADKAQVAAMVARLLALPERPTPPDAADALALAICHLWRAAPVVPLRVAAR